jgi:MerR family copper efflux transcriptional regulator
MQRKLDPLRKTRVLRDGPPPSMSNNIRLPIASLDTPPSGTPVENGDGALLQVGDLAREAGKTVRAIHLYEELGLLQPAARSKGRYRLYSRDALMRVRWIGRLQEMGFSLTEIQTVVREWETLRSAPRAMIQMKETYKRKLDEAREHIRRLQALEHELKASLAYLDTCEVCDPERMLSACKACDLHQCGEHVPELIAGFRAS